MEQTKLHSKRMLSCKLGTNLKLWENKKLVWNGSPSKRVLYTIWYLISVSDLTTVSNVEKVKEKSLGILNCRSAVHVYANGTRQTIDNQVQPWYQWRYATDHYHNPDVINMMITSDARRKQR